jgi:hypothetical protein
MRLLSPGEPLARAADREAQRTLEDAPCARESRKSEADDDGGPALAISGGEARVA